MKKSFTLAEVLITLTIIGVIAAITIPNLMQSYKKHEVEVKVKEAYSILSNAIKMAEAENGGMDTWEYKNYLNTQNFPNDFSEKYIYPYLKITKKCGMNTNGLRYEKIGTCFSSSTNILGLNNSSTYGSSYYSTAILSNGMIIGILPTDMTSGGYRGLGVQFAIDIDGKKGKSIAGKDVFLFTLKPINGNCFLPGGYYLYDNNICKDSYNIKKITNNSTYGACNTSATWTGETVAGSLCAALIAKNGWKIPDNYPVKKF